MTARVDAVVGEMERLLIAVVASVEAETERGEVLTEEGDAAALRHVLRLDEERVIDRLVEDGYPDWAQCITARRDDLLTAIQRNRALKGEGL